MKTLAVAVALLALGCGQSRGWFACLVGSGTSQVCVETETQASDQVECGNGTQVEACPLVGADGACVHVVASEAGSLTQRTWYYSAAPDVKSQEMAACANTGGTWLEAVQ